MLPRLGSSKLVTEWMLVTLAASIIAALDGGFVARTAALIPSRVLHGEIWRLVTWPFVEPGPLGLILTVLAIFKLGSDLSSRWGDRRLQRFMTHIILAAAVATCVLALLGGQRYMHHLGGWAIADALVIAWARQFPDRTLTLYGLAHLNGRMLINVTIAINVVYAIYAGPLAVAPELAACAAAFAYPQRWLPR
jgi:membrane associated rhomboid family serine protease